MQRDKVNCNYGKSDADIAFVFACPGKFELKNNKVLSGNTGKNLNLVLEKLYEWNKNIFPCYRITISFRIQRYKSHKGRCAW